MRMQVQSRASPNGLRIQYCCELWYRFPGCLGSRIAVAVVKASSYSSNLNSSLVTSTCRGCSPKKTKEEKGKERKERKNSCVLNGIYYLNYKREILPSLLYCLACFDGQFSPFSLPCSHTSNHSTHLKLDVACRAEACISSDHLSS